MGGRCQGDGAPPCLSVSINTTATGWGRRGLGGPLEGLTPFPLSKKITKTPGGKWANETQVTKEETK